MLNQPEYIPTSHSGHTRQSREASDESYKSQYRSDLGHYLHELKSNPDARSNTLIKYDYSNIICRTPEAAHSNMSGADHWHNVVQNGLASRYYIPSAESMLLLHNKEFFTKTFKGKIATVVECGPGGSNAVEAKTLSLLRAIEPDHYKAIDNIAAFATAAASLAKRCVKETSEGIQADFTKPLHLNANTPVLFAMFGGTLSQFSLECDDHDNNNSLDYLLRNLGRSISYNGYLIATIDTNKTPAAALSSYTGEHFSNFKRHHWYTAKECLEDSEFDPKSFSYIPFFDERIHAVVHRYLVEKDTEIQIDRERYILNKGSCVVTGQSQKWSRQDLDLPCKKAGWEIIEDVQSLDSPVRGLLLRAAHTSKLTQT